MTGEITLRGNVLPIGGLKEKVLAAHRAGIRTVLFPKKNVKDLEDIPEDVRNELELIPVEHMDDVVQDCAAGSTGGGGRHALRPLRRHPAARPRKRLAATGRTGQLGTKSPRPGGGSSCRSRSCRTPK